MTPIIILPSRHSSSLISLAPLVSARLDDLVTADSLVVWVCESSRNADQALDLARANRAGLRVW